MDKFNYNNIRNLELKYKNLVNKIATSRIVVFFIGIGLFCLVDKSFVFYILGFVFMFLFLILVLVHDRYYKLLDYYSKYVVVLNEYKARLDGSWRNFEDKGLDYSDDLLEDLNIIGENSLFQYLSICVTYGSRDKLIKKLSNPKISARSLLNNQNAISELCSNISFLMDFSVRMFKFRKKAINLEDNFKILDNDLDNKNIDLFFGVLGSFLTIILLLLFIIGIVSFRAFFAMFLFNFILNFIYFLIYKNDFDNIFKLCKDYSMLIDVYKLIKDTSFNSRMLKEIREDVVISNDAIRKLRFIDDLNNLKNNILSSFIFNGLFSVNIIVMFLFKKFQIGSVNNLKKGVLKIEELEVLISLAGIGVVNKDVSFPVLVPDVSLKFDNLRHPLIDADVVVGNDFFGNNGVNVITGSNMGGKTSFIKTIGINLILMCAGTYVCADNFCSSYFKIFTSINVSDDINKGVSTFYGELLRVKEAIDCDYENRMVLIDEIFRGTNYNDRMFGALNVIKKLNDGNTILFVTTHDFEVCDFEVSNLKNYYVKEYYEGGVIKFDYKIRKGKCNSTNAKYLMKMLGIVE